MLAAASATILIWGGTPVVTKVAVDGLDAVVVGILRTVIASAVVLPVVAFGGVAFPRTTTERGLLALSALGGFVVFPLLFSLGLARTSAAHGALVLASLPIFTGLFGALFERRAPRGRWWLGAGVALAGEVALIAYRFGLGGAGAGLAGDLLVVLSCAGAALGYVAGGRLSRTLGTWPTTLWGLTAGGILLVPALALVGSDTDWTAIGVDVWLAVGYLALLSSILAYVAWYWALARGGFARVGAAQFAQPVVSLALAALLLAEPITPPLAASAAVILIGIAIARRR